MGTPQGEVLSPLLLNILIDEIAQYPFPQGTELFIYADDILLQCNACQTLTLAIHQLEDLCTYMGLVIN